MGSLLMKAKWKKTLKLVFDVNKKLLCIEVSLWYWIPEVGAFNGSPENVKVASLLDLSFKVNNRLFCYQVKQSTKLNMSHLVAMISPVIN